MRAAQNVSGNGSAQRGATVFAKACSICHSIDSDNRKFGPGLAVVARKGRLPSGKDASPETILNQINNGGGGMPSFADFLQPEQKEDLIAFIRAPQ